MKTVTTPEDLQASIAELELKQAIEADLMKQQFRLTYESLKPVNFVKSTLKEVAESPEIKDILINTSIGLAAGYISKSLIERSNLSPVHKLIGTAVLFGVTNIAAKNPDAVKALTLSAVKLIAGIMQSTPKRS